MLTTNEQMIAVYGKEPHGQRCYTCAHILKDRKKYSCDIAKAEVNSFAPACGKYEHVDR